jgi:hypothetical protein
MGHVSPHIIFSNYREIVTPEEAERYWQIFPPQQSKMSCQWRSCTKRQFLAQVTNPQVFVNAS